MTVTRIRLTRTLQDEEVMQHGTADSFREDAPQPASAAMIAVGTDDGDEVAEQEMPPRHAHLHGGSDRDGDYEEGQDEAVHGHAMRGWSSAAGSGIDPRGAGSGQGGAVIRGDGRRHESYSRGFRGSTQGRDGDDNSYLRRGNGHGHYLYGRGGHAGGDADADIAAGDSGMAEMEASGGPAAAEGGVVMTGPNQGEVSDSDTIMSSSGDAPLRSASFAKASLWSFPMYITNYLCR